MTEPKFTPAPWSWEGNTLHNGKRVVLAARPTQASREGLVRGVEDVANDRLIATSPKLYAALDRASRALAVAVRAAGGDPAEHEACVEAFAALAEARGER